MSETPREWRFYIDDMIGFAQKVQTYTHGLDQAAFVASITMPPSATWS